MFSLFEISCVLLLLLPQLPSPTKAKRSTSPRRRHLKLFDSRYKRSERSRQRQRQRQRWEVVRGRWMRLNPTHPPPHSLSLSWCTALVKDLRGGDERRISLLLKRQTPHTPLRLERGRLTVVKDDSPGVEEGGGGGRGGGKGWKRRE